jgi:phosphatidylserine/phosphatidylglycerophosphate/cardiolipin synthase-like enzyme
MRSPVMSDASEASTEKSLLQPGRNCWRVEQANRASLIVDADDYYRHALRAMLDAKSQIMLIGWDVDTRVRLADEPPPEGAPTALGPLLSWISKRRPELDIYILVWDHAALSIPGRGTTMLRLARWATKKRIHLKFDHSHPLAGSHHQKILVIDDALAFCGGIDITADRWDTRHHKDEEPGRRRPFTRRAYEPWHDATMAIDGKAAEAIGDQARIRWKVATGKDLHVPADRADAWPAELKPAFRDVEVGIARTRGKEGNLEEIREVEALFVDLIGCAKRFVYVETQYFASRVIAEAIGRRLAEPDCPEFVIVNPKTAYGWLDETVMSPARYELVKALWEKDRNNRFRIYYPLTEGGAEIYVHAKIMIVDDHYLRVGSANMNNRSMGLDSECDLLIDGRDREEVRRTISEIRYDLLAEHLGLESPEVEQCYVETGSLIGCIEKLRGSGRTLEPLAPEEPTKIEKGIAKRELADPEAADPFEPQARPGLLKGIKRMRPPK